MITRDVIPESETDEYIDYLCTSYNELDGVTRWVDRVWKSGTSEFNREQLQAKAETATEFFRDKYWNWDTLTQAQKDAAVKQGMRALANLCALLADKLDDPGV